MRTEDIACCISVMAVLVPAIPTGTDRNNRAANRGPGGYGDGRDKPGHDDNAISSRHNANTRAIPAPRFHTSLPPSKTRRTPELPWLTGRDLELVMGQGFSDWLGWKF
jgi:hypothetical protein